MKSLKYLLLSCLSGIFLGLSWPTYGLTYLIFIGFVPLFILIKTDLSNYPLKLFGCLFLSFLLWNTISTNWLFHASLAGMLFAIIVNSALMSLTFMLFSVVSKRINEKLSYIFMISLWISFEKFHLIWDFSWPWLNLGNVFSSKIELIQWYEYTGTFGGTLWIILINILIFKVFEDYSNKKNITKKCTVLLVFFALPVTLSKYIFETIDIKGKPTDFFIVQPNIDPYNDKYKASNFDNYLYLYNILKKNKVKDHTIIAPETFFSEGIQKNSFRHDELNRRLQIIKNEFNSEILSGIELFEIIYDSTKIKDYSNQLNNGRWLNLFNSATFISDKIQYYNKSKLVVGVEKMPYKKILEPIIGGSLMDFGGSTYTRGYEDSRKNFSSINKFKISPIICYESIYGEYVTEYTKGGSNIFAIITNDGWWDNSQGHKQHISYSRLRAIENRRNIVRSANTGISAMINYKGQIINEIGYGQEGFIKENIELLDDLTFYVRYGDFIFRISFFFLIIIFLHYFATILKR